MRIRAIKRAQVLTSALWVMLGLGAIPWFPADHGPGPMPLAAPAALAQETGSAQADALYFARWNINYGEYLLDVGKYLEALEAFQTALEAAPNPQVRAEAALQRASTFAIFLDAYDEARQEYEQILQDNTQTPQSETARYRLALLLFDQQLYDEAILQLDAYLNQHPRGRFARSAALLLQRSQRALSERQPSDTPPPLPEPSPLPAPGPTVTERPKTPVTVEPSRPTDPAPVPLPTPAPPSAVAKSPETPEPPTASVPAVPPEPAAAPPQPPAPAASQSPQDHIPPAPTPSIASSPSPVPTPVVQVAAQPQVRVRLIKQTNQLDILSPGTITVTSISGQQLFRGTGAVTLRSTAETIVIGSATQQAREVRITATAPLTLKQKTVQCSGRKNPVKAGRYRGDLQVFLHSGELRAVNELDMEHYLYGVVPAEVPASWPLEALKTQAIAARTYALYQTQHRHNWRYDLVDSDGDQVYKGLQCESTTSTKAVDDTRGTVLLYQDRPILAMYSANTGHHSASVEHVFSKSLAYLVGVSDPYSPTQPMGQWTRTHEEQEIRSKLATIGLRFESIRDLRPVDVTPSGRITKIAVVHNKGSRVIRARTTLRRVLNLPEVLLKVSQKNHSFTFEGSGFGHGVGYSQWGAKAMAATGKSAQDILHFYYHNVTLKQVW
jgi:stage II sporulation protein D